MTSSFRAIALVSTFLVAACGGGGGGGTGGASVTPGGPQSVAITENNAKPVAANALDTAQNTSATRGATGLPVGVQVDASAAASANFQVIAEAARFAARSFPAAALPAGVVVNETASCSLGGTASISGRVASASGLSAGDTLTVVMNGCTETAGTTVSGQLTISVVSGSLTSLPFHVVLATTVTNLTVTSGGVSVVANGDARLDWTASATSQTLIASGPAISTTTTVSGATHTNTLRDFTQQLTISGSTLTGTVSATVESDSSKLGSGTVTYTISTPTPVVWNASTRTASAGVIKVVGANNSQLQVTINADSSVTIQVDANGDGVFEKSIASTTAELAGLI